VFIVLDGVEQLKASISPLTAPRTRWPLSGMNGAATYA